MGCWAVMQYRPERAAPLADWLNDFLSQQRTLEIATEPDLPDDLRLAVRSALDQAGTITADRIG